jgi:NAD(P)-dependent dehydrogenase (short-subunit alcohol dehydrogenase family)
MGKAGKYDSPFSATLKGIKDLYSKKGKSVVLPEILNLCGKTIMITGASSGLGFATAKRLAQAGARVIMAMRSGIPEKGDEISATTGNPNVNMYFVDLLDFESILQLLAKLESDRVVLDMFISNAAMVPLKSRRTKQGLDEMFMVNYLAPFFLINNLVNRGILKNERSKIIIVSSESHRNPKMFAWESFGKYEDYRINETVSRYGYSKLLLTTFGIEFASRLNREGDKTQVRMLCPGPVNSKIAREAPDWMHPLLRIVFAIFFKSPQKASDPILYFATESSKDANPIGYLFLMHPRELDLKAYDDKNRKRLWEMSEILIKGLGYHLIR